MSDLAPFVAAALRDKVVADLQDELRALRLEIQQQRRQSQLVSITGPKGRHVYAQASFQEDGNYDYSPELWKVEFVTGKVGDTNEATTDSTVPCTVAQLADMEVRIGGICKAKCSGALVEGFVNDLKNNYNFENKTGAMSLWFGGSSGIWLNIRIGPIEKDHYAALRDYDLSGDGLLTTLSQFVNEDAKVAFTEVSFLISYIDGAMKNWGIPPGPGDR